MSEKTICFAGKKSRLTQCGCLSERVKTTDNIEAVTCKACKEALKNPPI